MKKKFFTKFLMVIAMLFGLVVTGGNLAVNAAGYEKATSIAVGDTVVLVCESAGKELSEISTTSTKFCIFW